MTPRNPWRRRWRDTVVPVLWLLVVSVIIGGAAGINSAHATPASPGQLYADEHAAEVCSALDIRPTVPGVINVLITLETAGLSTHESGVAIAESVVFVCPIHANLLRQFVAHYKTDRSVAA